jgi:hypothetical protein
MKKKRLDDDAEQVAIYLNTAERMALNAIGERRKKRGEERTSPSQVVADGLWKILTETEKISRNKIEELADTGIKSVKVSGTVKIFPKL